ncbi:hypothetical protein ACMGDH_06600 [Sphingomonas sp. DT-207]|uniref:DMP19 family protein n=1 Tax=Sphingomonas sp. DT-207 TaxID=3396167 RepID=UPI003F1E067B
MFAASLLVVALAAGVLLWIFARRSPRLSGFARSAPAAEALPGRTRRAGDGLVYHPPADPAPAPILAPVVPLGLSPGVDAEPEEAELAEADESAFASVTWDADAEEEEEFEEAFEAAPEPAPQSHTAPPPLGLAPGYAVPEDEAEDADDFVPATRSEPEPAPEPVLTPAPRVRTSPALGLTPYDASADADEDGGEDDYVPPVWQPEPEEAGPLVPPLTASVPAAPVPLPDPVAAAPELADFDWPRTAALRLQELGALLPSGGFAAYFAEVTSPHAWDEMIEALRAIVAPEAAEIATAAGEAQWPFHEQGTLAPRAEFAEADAHWAALDPDLPAMLDAWLDAQSGRSTAFGRG